MRYIMRQKLLSFGDDSYIKDESTRSRPLSWLVISGERES